MNIDFSNITVRMVKYQTNKADKMTQPHIWFAWHPVSIGYLKYRWLEYVVRQYYTSHIDISWYSSRYSDPEYKPLDEEIFRRLKDDN